MQLTATQEFVGNFRHGPGEPELGDWTRSDSHVWIKELPMKNLFVRFVKDESGATAIEYGLIAAGISVAIIAVVNGLGTALNTKFSSISSQLK
jgi:pilus assembly protein Flp/PilA